MTEDTAPIAASEAVAWHELHRGVGTAFGALVSEATERYVHDVARAFGGAAPAWLDTARVAEKWQEGLVARLTRLSLRTVILELNVARLQGELAGDDSLGRFHRFFELLSEPDRLKAFLGEYGVLGCQIAREVQSAGRCSIEALIHMRDDAPSLAASLNVHLARDRLVALYAHDGGDRHNHGRSVLLAQFASGRQVLYKPRPSQVDLHFRRLLSWISARDDSFQFRTPAVVAGAHHGWCEVIEHRACAGEEDARSFYRRQGEYLALLYAIDACDFHFENIIAEGPWPVLVDLEGLFHAPLPMSDMDSAAARANRELQRTVLNVGLLPSLPRSGGGSGGADLGGISAPVRQMSATPVLSIVAAATDRMSMVSERVSYGAHRHRVALPDGRRPDHLEHARELEEGFVRMYGLLERTRDDLMADDGPLQAFRRDKVRFILRSTQVYGRMLEAGSHPDLLRDDGARRAFMARLRIRCTRGTDDEVDALRRIGAAEQEDLARDDIPIFWTRVDGLEVEDTGGRKIRGLLQRSAFEAVRENLTRLGARDLAFQTWLLRLSLAASTARPSPASHATISATHSPRVQAGSLSRQALRQAALAAACDVADHLDGSAFKGADGATWLGLQETPRSAIELRVLQVDLYDGLAGILLFLAHLARATGRQAHSALAQACMATWQSALSAGERPRDIGAFTGIGGLVYTLTHLGRLWRRPELWLQAEALITELEANVERDQQFDLISGAAGAIAALLSLHTANGSARAIQVAVACGDHLLASAVSQSAGWGWPAAAFSHRALGGFSHGAAGIGWALARLAVASGQSRFMRAAHEALAYDRSLRVPGGDHWRDMRGAGRLEGPADEERAGSWCHGAPGIALARLGLPKQAGGEGDARIRRDLASALRSTRRRGFGGSHCMCHGDLGNLETLLQAERRLPAGTRWSAQVDRELHAVLAGIRAHGWICGTPRQVEAPGLMTGLAGIGYGLLRAAMPDQVPALLLLEPPDALREVP